MGTTHVAIWETDVYGTKAYHAKCLDCGWETKRKNRQEQAVKMAKGHRCPTAKKAKG